MNLARASGHVLLWSGFFGGAFSAVRSTEISEAPWSTISWPLYGVAMAVAVTGVLLLRSEKFAARVSDTQHTGDVTEMAAIVKRLLLRLQTWQTDEGKLPVHDVHGQIDKHLTEDLNQFADLRESLVKAFGLQDYARIMTAFALAERSINRMWSASADGYVDEVDVCLERAVGYLQNTIQRLDAAKSGMT